MASNRPFLRSRESWKGWSASRERRAMTSPPHPVNPLQHAVVLSEQEVVMTPTGTLGLVLILKKTPCRKPSKLTLLANLSWYESFLCLRSRARNQNKSASSVDCREERGVGGGGKLHSPCDRQDCSGALASFCQRWGGGRGKVGEGGLSLSA